MNNWKAPRIRFKGFTDDWEQCKLGDVLRTLPFKQFLKTPEQGGKYEIIQQGNEPIIGYANGEPCESFRNTVIFGDHTLSLYKPKKPFFVATDGVRILQGTNDMDGYYLLSLLEGNSLKSEGYKRYYSILLDREVLLTENHCEQVQIGLCFKHLDHLITLHQRKLEKLKIIKKAMLENCFPKNGEKVPRFRFSGFTGDWEQRKLSELYATIGNAFVGTATPYYVESGHFYLESNNIKDGQINHSSEIFVNDEFYEKQRDKWLHTGDMVMVQSGHVGHAAVIPAELDNSAAHALIMFRNPKEKIEPYFLNYQYQTNKSKNKIESITIGNTIKHILSSDMQEFIVDMPDYNEQTKIGQYFSHLDHLITLHQRKLEKLKLIKKSFLEKMFV